MARWYDIPEVSERLADHYTCFAAMAMVWGTRIMAEINERRALRARPVNPPPSPAAATSPTNGQTAPEGSGVREPPDPRNPRTIDVDGFGRVDIPPVVGNMQ